VPTHKLLRRPSFAKTRFPSLYPILDFACVFPHGAPDPAQRWDHLRHLVQELTGAGVTLLQYRNKQDSDVLVSQDALVLGQVLRETAPPMTLILNDRPALVGPAGWDGVHVGQDDLSPAQARFLAGPRAIVGISAHTDEQVRLANLEAVDYIAIGPVFSTISKTDTSPVIGLAGVERARALTSKPLVAIGGITLENAPSVYDAGADSLAVISAIFGRDHSPAEAAKEFLRIL
jgi:thiamine-phosphate pyrophosphorylase